MLVCPVCLGSDIVEFRGRAHAQCVTCESLERHRLFWLFVLSLRLPNPHLILSAAGKFKRELRVHTSARVESLKAFDSDVEVGEYGAETIVFLDNVVGFGKMEERLESSVARLVLDGVILAFTCSQGVVNTSEITSPTLRRSLMNARKFDPSEYFGTDVFSLCGLGSDGPMSQARELFFSMGEERCGSRGASASEPMRQADRSSNVVSMNS